MKTLLVLSSHPDFAASLRASVNPEQLRIAHRLSFEEAEPMMAHGLIDACILDIDLTGIQAVWVVEKIRRRNAQCPIIIFTDAREPQWEEEAYLQGVTQILSKPVRPRMFTALMDRLLAAPTGRPVASAARSTGDTAFMLPPTNLPPGASQTAEILRDFSAILTHSLDSSAMLKQFLLLMRKMLSVNRAVVFLRQPDPEFSDLGALDESRRLRAVSAIGVPASLLEHFELSLDTGIGGQVFRSGRILRRNSEDTRDDVEAQKEFELLATHVAVPMFDRETLIGVAMFAGRITGEPLVNAELELIFHLLEQVALAIRNIWLHTQLSSNNEMMAGVLRELSSACVVVSRDLKILHANKTARRFFVKTTRPTGEMEFADLPPALAAKIYQVLRTGAATTPFRHEPEGEKGVVYSISVVPFQRPGTAQPTSALLVADDLTQSEQLRRLEVEAANLRLVKTMADRLAHEVGNAMVPLSTHQQLLAEKYKDPEFRASLTSALADGVKRVTRLINQMRFLARDAVAAQEKIPLTPLIEEAYQEARKYQPVKSASLKCEDGGTPSIVTGDRAALKHALTEVMINALQANPTDPKVGVRLQSETGGEEAPGYRIEVQDNGGGFTPEAAQKAASPFFTTRNVGLGLGLAVTRKIIETHHGKLEIVAPHAGRSGLVRISLPIEAPGMSKS
jgi:signal transduction histidine kinase/DNA-binding NarL/FixJ family response regulator